MLIKDKIKNKDYFTSSENQIAEYLCDHSKEVLDMSLEELSNALYVSKSTIIRFCKKLGFCGHKELCVQLAKEINTFYLSGDEHGPGLVEKKDSSSEVAQKIYSICYHAITVSYNELDLKALEEAADLLYIHQRVRIFACGDDYLPAIKIAEQLALSGIDANVCSVPGTMEADAMIMNLRMAAVLIASGKNVSSLQRVADILHERMVPIILISGAKKSPLSNIATVTIRVPVASEITMNYGTWLGTGTMMVCQILCALAFQKDYDNNVERVNQIKDLK